MSNLQLATFQKPKPRPWLSVIVPTFNAEQYLARTFDSILAQNSSKLEVLLIDDGSSDRTLDIIEEYREFLPIRVLQAPTARNWVTQTNRALAEAQGEFISFLHQDDCWEPQRVSTLQAVAKRHPEAKILLHQSKFIDKHCRSRGKWDSPFPAREAPLKEKDLLQALTVQNFIAISAVAIHRSALPSSKLLDEALWYTADWKCWIELVHAGQWVYCPKVLSSFRIHRESQTVQGTRSRGVQDYRQQQLQVQDALIAKHQEVLNKEIVKAARFSTSLNIALLSLLHGHRIHWLALFRDAVKLGPRGLRSYLLYSRIRQRLSARLRVHFDSRLA